MPKTAKFPGQRALTNEELDVLNHIDGQPHGTAYNVSGCIPKDAAPATMYVDALALLIASCHVVEVAFTHEKGRTFCITAKGRRALQGR